MTRRYLDREGIDLAAKSELGGASDGSGDFRLQLVLFPAAELLSREDFGVVALIDGFLAMRRRWIVNPFANPSLPEANGRAAITAFVSVASAHFTPHFSTRAYMPEETGPDIKNVSRVGHLQVVVGGGEAHCQSGANGQ